MSFNLDELLTTTSESIDELLEPLNKSPELFAFVSMFLVLYGGLAKPKLPYVLRQMFENALFRVGILFLILWRSNKNTSLSIMLAIGFTVTMQLLNEEKSKEKFESISNKINQNY